MVDNVFVILLYRKLILQEKPLGAFIRELVGLDMNAAKEAFSSFLDEGAYNAEQMNFHSGGIA